ncbi:MAG: Fic family protein [Syntrophales bacterium]|nr:Fic family protein [Syntrophales bacterium]
MDRAGLYKSFQDRYLNKIEIGFRLPGAFSLPEVWQEIQNERRSKAEPLALQDEKGRNFWYVNTKPLQAKLHQIDSRGKDSLYSYIKPEIENELVFDSIIEEAWASNIIEGAFTTHKRAQELVRRNLTPKDKNELMMKNNHQAMTFIIENRESDFSIDFILNLHHIITQDTLEDPEYAGKLRDDDVFIRDKANTVIFKPMAAEKIEKSLNNLITWVNTQSEEDFIHPIVKASIIHFFLVYVHPFFDGNGRTARALFYFYLLKERYDFFKYFSISALIAKQKEKYYKAIKEVEDYDNDLTYFLLYSADIVMKSIDEILDKIIKKYMSDRISKSLDLRGVYLNKRQYKLIKILIDQDHKSITTRRYQKIFKVSYGTARSDLNELSEKGLLQKRKLGKGFLYYTNFDSYLT